MEEQVKDYQTLVKIDKEPDKKEVDAILKKEMPNVKGFASQNRKWQRSLHFRPHRVTDRGLVEELLVYIREQLNQIQRDENNGLPLPHE